MSSLITIIYILSRVRFVEYVTNLQQTEYVSTVDCQFFSLGSWLQFLIFIYIVIVSFFDKKIYRNYQGTNAFVNVCNSFVRSVVSLPFIGFVTIKGI